MMKKFFLCLVSVHWWALGNLFAQTFPVEGMRDNTPSVHAFTNATIVASPELTYPNATLVIRDGIIEAVGTNVTIPKDAVIHDCKGLYIYPGLIDAYTTYGHSDKEMKMSRSYREDEPQPYSNKKGAYNWNQAVKAELNAAESFDIDKDKAQSLRGMGFTSVLSFLNDGIFRGTALLVNLGEDNARNQIIDDDAASMLSFNKGSSTQDYPSSLMGSIALIRQTFYDMQWYKAAKDAYALNPNQTPVETNITLEALVNQWQKKIPFVFDVSNELNFLRASKIAKEFNLPFILKGSGYEYRRTDAIRQTGYPVIIPLTFPKAYDVSDPYDAVNISLEQMKHWELAPANAMFLEKQGIIFAITTAGLDKNKGDDFWANLRKAVKYGLTETTALKSLTTVPAKLLNASQYIGTIEKGKLANFLVCKENLFSDKNTIYQNWIKGQKYDVNEFPPKDIRGAYDITLMNKKYTMEIGGEIDEQEFNLFYKDTLSVKMKGAIKDNSVTITFRADSLGNKGTVRLNGLIDGTKISGTGEWTDGTFISWSAVRTKEFTPKAKEEKEKKEEPITLGEIWYPNMAYGLKQIPQQEMVLIKNVTIWTNAKDGILKNADVLVVGGKISKVGTNLAVPSDAKIIDGTGKHLTPGIIDEHSHIAISEGVNEGTQAVSAEVSIGNVVDCNDVDIYRNLSGGVTSAQLLHGSANPMGGQSQIIKLRWGMLPEEMKFEGAPGTIKFALGENVKQSNWGDRNVIRYPQTRMGVEQIHMDEFQAAKDYRKAWEDWKKAGGEKSLSAGQAGNLIPPRKDLELETILEILDNKRFITCHSYVQSEIVMLMRVSEKLGFHVNTFTHILEGYKVADKMKAYGVNASTFSDWWAYKYEVTEAVPYNPAILTKVGVNTSVNSDDAEMARRLNQEAAKSVKYGGLLEEEALKLCTLNPAKMLHIDNRVGAIESGKDADIVLWSDNPLSIYAKALQTYVDGRLFYDSERDKRMREEIRKERARLIQKMMDEKKSGKDTQGASKKWKEEYDCNSLESDYNSQEK